MSIKLRPFLLVTWLLFFSGAADKSFSTFRKAFIEQYTALNIPGMEYDYKDYFNAIPDEKALQFQYDFFTKQQEQLLIIPRNILDSKAKLDYDQLDYEITFNLQRIFLEQQWVRNGRKIPAYGLHNLDNYKDWYQLFIKKFTSMETTPEQVYALGEKEVKRVQAEISSLMKRLGFNNHQMFYLHLQNDSFYISDKNVLIAEFEKIDKTVRKHLPSFTGVDVVPPVYAMEWPGAGANTPPGMYLNHESTAYGKDVFQFNFYNGRYNRRAMEWLYMHEAIPGHHMQSSVRKPHDLQDLFLYPGNFEGWACYVEYYGQDIGLYADPYSYLGKWEWDLVRSARLVLDAGIHYYGWSREQALQYWKETLPGQDDIAEREITRVTNWCGQTLSYKIGAAAIMDMRDDWLVGHPGDSIKNFHNTFLRSGNVPLTILKKHLS